MLNEELFHNLNLLQGKLFNLGKAFLKDGKNSLHKIKYVDLQRCYRFCGLSTKEHLNIPQYQNYMAFF